MIVRALVRYWPPLWPLLLPTQRLSDQRATSRPGLGWCRGSAQAAARTGSAVSANKVTAICATCSWPARSPLSAMPRSTAPSMAVAHGIAGAAADEDRRHRACQQDRQNGLGDDGQGRALQATRRACGVNEIAPGIWRDVKVGKGEQHVMQSRSIRRSGQPSYPLALSNAGY